MKRIVVLLLLTLTGCGTGYEVAKNAYDSHNESEALKTLKSDEDIDMFHALKLISELDADEFAEWEKIRDARNERHSAERDAEKSFNLSQITLVNYEFEKPGRYDSTVTFDIENKSEEAISFVEFCVEFHTEGRSVEWGSRYHEIYVSGGVEPGETRRLSDTEGTIAFPEEVNRNELIPTISSVEFR